MMIARARSREFRLIAAGAVVLAVADYLLGLTPWLLLAGACGYVSWHVYHVHLLARWLASGGRQPEPETWGLWAQVFESLTRLRRQNTQAQETPAQGRDAVPAGGRGDARRCNRAGRRRVDPVDEPGVAPAARPGPASRRRPARGRFHSTPGVQRRAAIGVVRRTVSSHLAESQRDSAPDPHGSLRRQPQADAGARRDPHLQPGADAKGLRGQRVA